MNDPVLRDDMIGAARAGQHIGQFYSNIEQMIVTACRYVVEGLRRREAVIVVTTRAHWSAMVGRLAMRSTVDLSDAVMSGQLRHVDADIVLSAVLDDGVPNSRRFQDRTSSLIEKAHQRFGAVRVFAELTGMLWQQGNPWAAMRLEELWNGLAAQLPFALLCPYHNDLSDSEAYNPSLKRVCSVHSDVVPDVVP